MLNKAAGLSTDTYRPLCQGKEVSKVGQICKFTPRHAVKTCTLHYPHHSPQFA